MRWFILWCFIYINSHFTFYFKCQLFANQLFALFLNNKLCILRIRMIHNKEINGILIKCFSLGLGVVIFILPFHSIVISCCEEYNTTNCACCVQPTDCTVSKIIHSSIHCYLILRITLWILTTYQRDLIECSSIQ